MELHYMILISGVASSTNNFTNPLCYSDLMLQWYKQNLTKILDRENGIVFVDTDGNSREEKHFINHGEISVVGELIDGFLSIGINDIIITTPYKQQERMLQFQLNYYR